MSKNTFWLIAWLRKKLGKFLLTVGESFQSWCFFTLIFCLFLQLYITYFWAKSRLGSSFCICNAKVSAKSIRDQDLSLRKKNATFSIPSLFSRQEIKPLLFPPRLSKHRINFCMGSLFGIVSICFCFFSFGENNLLIWRKKTRALAKIKTKKIQSHSSVEFLSIFFSYLDLKQEISAPKLSQQSSVNDWKCFVK